MEENSNIDNLDQETEELDEGYSIGSSRTEKDGDTSFTIHDVHHKPLMGKKKKVGEITSYHNSAKGKTEYASGSGKSRDDYYTDGHKTKEDAFKKLVSQKPHKGMQEDLEEGSAADTLHPGAGSGGGDTKAETLATFTQLLAQLGKEDLSNLFNDVQAQFGANKAPGAVDNSANNRSTVNAKPSAAVGTGAWKEDIDDMFGGNDLTEDFREKASIVFEAAVNTRITLEEARLQEEFDAIIESIEEDYEVKLQEEANRVFEDVSSKLDQYLDYVVENWMEENQLAVESTLRADIAEDFIQGLQGLFSEHYIRVPDEKIDLVAEMKTELDELKEKLNETIDAKLALESVIEEATKEATLEEVSEGLVVTQAEKLRILSEGIEYTDADTYRRKLEIVKENYFNKKSASTGSGFITEEIDGDDGEESVRYTAPGMDMYMNAIKKSVK